MQVEFRKVLLGFLLGVIGFSKLCFMWLGTGFLWLRI